MSWSEVLQEKHLSSASASHNTASCTYTGILLVATVLLQVHISGETNTENE